jgi:hypothetical protein
VGLHSPQPAGESRVRHANRRAGGAHPALRIHVRTRAGHGAFRLLHHSRGLLVNVLNSFGTLIFRDMPSSLKFP